MSIDYFYFVKGETRTRLGSGSAAVKEEHSILIMKNGQLGLLFYDDSAQAVSDFEKWRREPCERIALMDTLPQPSWLSDT